MRSKSARLSVLVGSVWFWGAASAVAGAPKCPAGQRPTLAGCRSPAPPARSVAKPLATPSAAKPGDPAARPAQQAPTDVALRPEPARQARRDHLLVAEIAELEQLLAKTPRTATDRARLVLRLADDYAELAALKQRDVTRLEKEAESAARPSPPAHAPTR